MDKIRGTGEGVPPFDGMMMEYDAAAARQEKEEKKQFFKESNKAGDFDVPATTEEQWKMQDKIIEKDLKAKQEIRLEKEDTRSFGKVDNTRNRIPVNKGEQSYLRSSFDEVEKELDAEKAVMDEEVRVQQEKKAKDDWDRRIRMGN